METQLPKEILDFYLENKEIQFFDTSKLEILPWLKMKINFPYEEMLREAISVKDLFVEHRDKNEGHSGWYSLCIHGISADKTNTAEMYGLDSNEAIYDWTEIADRCPVTTDFFKHKAVWYEKYARLRFMLLEPGGYIAPHVDVDKSGLRVINYALNNPKNCNYVVKGFGIVPWEAGDAYMLDIHNEHCVINMSDEPRYHIIAHGPSNKKELKQLMKESFQTELSQ